MKFFKDYTLKWWEVGLFKIALIAIGIIIGATWNEFFVDLKVLFVLWVLFIIPSFYLLTTWWKQRNGKKSEEKEK